MGYALVRFPSRCSANESNDVGDEEMESILEDAYVFFAGPFGYASLQGHLMSEGRGGFTSDIQGSLVCSRRSSMSVIQEGLVSSYTNSV